METNFPCKLLVTNRQVANLCKAFASYLLTGIKLSKTQLSQMIKPGRFIGRLLGPLLKTGLPWMKNVIKPLATSVLIPSGLTAAASVTDALIHKKILESGKRPLALPKYNNTTTVIMSCNEMEDIIKIAKSLEDSYLLLKGVSETIEIEAKELKGGFLSMLLGTLGANLLGNILDCKGDIATSQGRRAIANRQGWGVIRAGYGSTIKNKDF